MYRFAIPGIAAMALLAHDAAAANTPRVRVTVEVRNQRGGVKCALFDGKEGFPKKVERAKAVVKAPIKDGYAVCVFAKVTAGTYAVIAFHDENKNGKLDTNWIGMPKEGVGASNNAKGTMGPPSFEDARFAVAAREVEQTIKLRY